jgi:DNA-binding response OmpR family regulator
VSVPRILVVDDDPDICDLVEIKLSRIGYEVHTRPDGGQGLDAARSLHPDLIVLDWMMPVRNGIEVLEAVRADADPSLASVPVLLATAKTQPDDLARCDAAGASGYLAKPFSLRELSARVEAMVGRPVG